ncbi:hypothetical protein AB0K00_48585 [Dactylosporangium sp. NPDC049525]|uniref:hypothetical protein n=1 Tax=Dactylosporangium sp. NPDC049525 TaxID=3154730 RepID=UPI0034488ED9
MLGMLGHLVPERRQAVLLAVALPAALYLGHRIVEQVDLAAGAWTQVVAGIWLATLPFALLGLVLGQLTAASDLPAVTNGVLSIGSLLGGLLVPVVLFPASLVDLAEALPTYRPGGVGRGAVDGHPDVRDAALVLAAWTVEAALVLAVRHWRTARRTG